MLKLACHCWSFSELSLDLTVQTIARLGFNYCDLGSGPHLKLSEAANDPVTEAQRIRHLLKHFNLQVTDLYLFLPNLASLDEGRRLYDIKLFQRLIPFAVELGVPGITLSPGTAAPQIKQSEFPVPGILKGQSEANRAADTVASAQKHKQPLALDYAKDSFRQLVELTDDTDLRLSLEPHMDSVAATPAQALAIIEASPGLSLTIDWAQFEAQDIPPDEVEPLLQHAAHIQLRQAAPGRLQTTHDEGTMNLHQIMAMLRDNDYSGAISLELINPGWHGSEQVEVIEELLALRGQIRQTLAEMPR